MSKRKPITEDEAAVIGAPVAGGAKTLTKPGELSTVAPSRPVKGDVVSDAEESYVASSVQYPFLSMDRALPQTIDEAEQQFGIDIYDKMYNEPLLGGVVRVLKILVLADGLSVTPSHPDPKQDANPEATADFEMATRVADYVRYVIRRLGDEDRPILRTLWNALDCFFKGHKLCEWTADVVEGGEWDGAAYLTSFKPKPRENYVFVLDEMNRFRGIIAKVPGGSIALRSGITYDLSKLSNAIAPEKLLIFTVDDNDGDPRGKSWFRQCYDPWYRKQILKPEEIKTGLQFGGGKISVIAPEEKSAASYTNPVTGKNDSLLNCIAAVTSQMANGGVGVYPFGTQVTVHQPSGDPTFFDTSFNRYDREMVTSFLLTARSILEARHGSKADTDSSQDLLDELKMYIRGQVCDTLTLKLFKWLVRASYGPEIAEKYCPVATMSKASRPDFAANATAVAALMTSGYLSEDQLPQIDNEILGIPERTPGSPIAGAPVPQTADDGKGGESGKKPANFQRSSGFQKENRSADALRRRLSEVDEGRSAKARAKQHEAYSR